jgi:5'-nucleotidase
MEGASLGVPALAVSLETLLEHHLSYSTEVDFSAAAYFTAQFARWLLEKPLPPDVNLLKVEVPRGATRETPWHVTRLSMQRYFEPLRPRRVDWSQPGTVGYKRSDEVLNSEPGSDVHTLIVKRQVSVTPLSLDLTSRVNLDVLERLIKEN